MSLGSLIRSRVIRIGLLSAVLFFVIIFVSCDDDRTYFTIPGPDPVDTLTVEEFLLGRIDTILSVNPNFGDDSDLTVLNDLIGDSRVICLGEATHGSSECFSMKVRMIKYLVENMGFDLIAFEGPYEQADEIDQYLKTGIGQPPALLRGMGFWTWNTQEVLDLIYMLRVRNRDNPEEKTVGFTGVDIQAPWPALDDAQSFIQQVSPFMVFWVMEQYSSFRAWSSNVLSYAGATLEEKDTSREGLQAVYDTLVAQESVWVPLASQEEYNHALNCAMVALQAEEYYRDSWEVNFGIRDKHMAFNLQTFLAQQDPDSKVILWAHNGHIGRIDFDIERMGWWLDDLFGEDLVTFGFSMHTGTVSAFAWDTETQSFGGLQAMNVSAPPEDSYGYHFHMAGVPMFMLDLRGIDYTDPSAEWLSGPMRFREIGAIYEEDHPEDFFTISSLPNEFDIIIHLDETTATEQLPYF